MTDAAFYIRELGPPELLVQFVAWDRERNSLTEIRACLNEAKRLINNGEDPKGVSIIALDKLLQDINKLYN